VCFLGLTSALPSKDIQNFIFADGALASVSDQLLSRKDISGVQVIYSWKTLEPSKGRYDFSKIEGDLNRINKHQKKLFVQVQDRFFTPTDRNIPDYLLSDPIYAGGLTKQADNPGEGLEEGSGWVAVQWNKNLRLRFQALLRALAKKFDGKIYGINLPESSADVDPKTDASGFEPKKYFEGELENLLLARTVFKKSFVVQYVNFWPGEWDNSRGFMAKTFEFAAKNGIGLGGPDIVPHKKAQMKNSYPFFNKYRGKLPLVAMAVQQPTLTYINTETSKPFTKEEILKFSKDYLGVDIIFWTTLSPWLKD
jgi:hypothetical protein